jgi:hypothetical protein
LSFFDEGEQSRRGPRPRRPAAATQPAADQRTVMIRRGVAVGLGLLVLILLVVGIRGCLSSQKKTALRDYNRNVTSLVQESDQTGQKFFQTLATAAGTTGATANTTELEPEINALRVSADDLVKRARRQEVPDDDDIKEAQDNLLTVLELRRDGIAKIAGKLASARAQSGADQAVNQITGQMQVFVASDVLYSQRVVPYIKRALDENDVTGQTIPTSQFLPDFSWLDQTQVAKRIGATTAGARQGPAAPGSHGHELTSVSVGNKALEEGGGNQVSAGGNPVFNVKFENQGENDESNVIVKVTIEGSGRPISVTKPVPQTRASTEASVEIPLGQQPPLNTPVTVTVEVQGVPGEESTDNNKKSYQVLFSQ